MLCQPVPSVLHIPLSSYIIFYLSKSQKKIMLNVCGLWSQSYYPVPAWAVWWQACVSGCCWHSGVWQRWCVCEFLAPPAAPPVQRSHMPPCASPPHKNPAVDPHAHADLLPNDSIWTTDRSPAHTQTNTVSVCKCYRFITYVGLVHKVWICVFMHAYGWVWVHIIYFIYIGRTHEQGGKN